MTYDSTELLWNKYAAELGRFIQTKVKNQTDAEDILQEVFIKVHLKATTIKDDAKIRAWLYQVARNAVADFWRKRDTLVPVSEQHIAPPYESNQRNRLLNCLPSLLAQLPAKYKAALVKSDLDQVNQKLLGQQLQLSYSGAKSRVQRARAMLTRLVHSCCHIRVGKAGSILSVEPLNNCRCGTC